MKVSHPEIVWHGTAQRILSIDFHPFINELVTGGSDQCGSGEASEFDGYAKAWDYEITPEGIKVTFKSALNKHTNNVSTVKYSPDGRYIATGSDDKTIIVWEIRQNYPFVGAKEKKKMWSPRYDLTGHVAEVSDLAWCPNSKLLISGGFDKRIIIWNVEKKHYLKVFEEHKKCIQGIAVDPFFNKIISQSSDRTVKIWLKAATKKDQAAFFRYATLDRFQINESKLNKPEVQNSKKMQQQVQQKDGNNEKQQTQVKRRLFYDQNVATFYRRPSISPDGQLFLFPAGQWGKEGEMTHCAFIYRANNLDRPTFVIPSGQQPTVCTKFCPRLFKKSNPKSGLLDHPYYMIFAVGTFNSVLVYSTQTMNILYAVGNHHYASITQLAWKDDRILAASSNDRTCSFMIFDEGQLGSYYQITDQKLKQATTRTPYESKQENKQILNPETATTGQVIRIGNGKMKIVPTMIQKF